MMDCSTLLPRFSLSCSSCLIRLSNPNLRSSSLRCFSGEERKLFFKSLKNYVKNPNVRFNSSSSLFPLKSCSRNPRSSEFCSIATETALVTSEVTICKVQRIVSEFQSLTEPIDRVKRLLHYATLLPRLDESQCVPHNQVKGCTVQVWLDASMDELGRMRFLADSDSEITKGFCSCLIWILDGSFPEEVVKLKAEDLTALNVGLHGHEYSRVNTWHNVLISMKKRTEALVSEREGKPLIDPFPSMVVSADNIHD